MITDGLLRVVEGGPDTEEGREDEMLAKGAARYANQIAVCKEIDDPYFLVILSEDDDGMYCYENVLTSQRHEEMCTLVAMCVYLAHRTLAETGGEDAADAFLARLTGDIVS